MIGAFHQRIKAQGTRFLTLALCLEDGEGQKRWSTEGGPSNFKIKTHLISTSGREKSCPVYFSLISLKPCIVLPVIVILFR